VWDVNLDLVGVPFVQAERCLVAEPEGVLAIGRLETTDQRELGLFPGRPNRGHRVAEVHAEQPGDPAGERDLAGPPGGLAAERQVVGGAVAEQDRE